ncbi:hypothetical protein IV498_18380 [Paenarthrobacter sp. Z7-10]|uniref:hypothetical protein n=1 Tax=Paenarthrobacter sp. Z7-10 TaxID=2787635 RepID=UPI0022A93CEC|nr:hypothetical protein [Paenarthrobacter sp. Z7-10]MCZ2405067.1 hypothetical protein [Paenarthrobacter sp. Z7-10]
MANTKGKDTTTEGMHGSSRGGTEGLAPGEVTRDAKGLGAMLGDADRSSLDDPVLAPGTADAAAIEDMKNNLTVYEDENGQHYAQDNPTPP